MKLNIKLLQQYRNKKISFIQLAKQHKLTPPQLSTIFKTEGLLTNRDLLKSTINHNFFSKIETKEQAYWLGFFVADGSYSYPSKECKIPRISFSASKKDKDHLLKIKNILCPNHHFNKSIRYKVQNTDYLSKEMYKFAFCSVIMGKDLDNFGFGHNKTYKELSLPNIDKRLMSHFIRGYFDGDGCIFNSKGMRKNREKYNNFYFSITAKTESLLLEISTIFKDMGITCKVSKRIRKQSTYFQLISSGKANNIKIRDYLYQNATIFLDRKRTVFNTISL